MSSRVSPDGMYYWDGQAWVSTLSADGRYRWNGAAWVPMAGRPYIAATGQALAPPRQPTSWTRPLQLGVGGWYVWSILYSLSIPFWMGGILDQITNESVANQQRLNPDTPPGFADTMHGITVAATWVTIVVLIAVFVVLLIGTWRRWTWIFYVVMVLLGLSVLLLPVDLFDAAVGQRFASTSSFTLPSWYYLLNGVIGLPGAAIFGWMLIALLTRGPWAMERAGR